MTLAETVEISTFFNHFSAYSFITRFEKKSHLEKNIHATCQLYKTIVDMHHRACSCKIQDKLPKKAKQKIHTIHTNTFSYPHACKNVQTEE